MEHDHGCDLVSRGHIVGRAGASLDDASWAANETVARIGQSGEQSTATALDRLATDGGPSVLHDLRIPIPGFTANIDHVVVSGRTITLIDSKVWKPGVYWTFRGRTRRGLELFPFGDKKTLPVAQKAVETMLRKAVAVPVVFATPLLVVHPSNHRTRMNLVFYRPAGATAVTGARLTARTMRRRFGTAPADPHVLVALAELSTRPQPRPSGAPNRTEHPDFDL